MRQKPTKAWICTLCGYIHYGDEPPAECPVCGADRELFEPVLETSEAAPAGSDKANGRRYVILGGGIAGVSAAEALRRVDPAGEITLVTEEPGLPYYRMSLTRYLAGEIKADELDLHPRAWYEERDIRLRDGVKITGWDVDGKSLIAGEERLPYDALILTNGAQPFTPPIVGTQLKHATTLRTRADAEAILAVCAARAEAGETPRVVCIGGGILGLETAGGLACRGAHVTVLENQPWMLSRQLNAPAARIFQAYLKGLGIDVVTQARTREITGVDGIANGVLLEGADAPIPADLVVISAGVRANLGMARQGGLEVKNGVIVDENMRTSRPEVFAAGDVTEFQGMLYGLWAPAQSQGAVAGSSAGGQPAVFRGVPRSTTLKVLGIDLFSAGNVNEVLPEGPLNVLLEAEEGQHYTGFLFREGVMVGAILLGDARLAGRVKKAMEERVDFSALLAQGSGVAEIRQAL